MTSSAIKQPAHRPSRRDDIVDAAIKVFAANGYADSAISDVAEEADVAVTAVYYHFAGKDDLFAAAMRRALASISTVVTDARPSTGMLADSEGLRLAIDAVWDWVDQNPHHAALVHIQLPGATRQMSAIRDEFQDLHVSRAFDYIEDPATPRHRRPTARLGAAMLTMRTLVDALMAVHAMRLADGPLSTASPDAVRSEVHRIARQMLLAP